MVIACNLVMKICANNYTRKQGFAETYKEVIHEDSIVPQGDDIWVDLDCPQSRLQSAAR
jgi:hypothetical protein